MVDLGSGEIEKVEVIKKNIIASYSSSMRDLIAPVGLV